MKKRFIGLLCFVIISFVSQSQKLLTKKSNEQWAQYAFQIPVNKSWSVNSDLGFRWRDEFSIPSQFVVRSALAGQVSDNLTVAGGFGVFSTLTDNSISRYEYRPHQEINHRLKVGVCGVAQRLRVEERFFSQPDNGFEYFLLRLRYRWQLNVPIAKWQSGEAEHKFSLLFAEEILVHTPSKHTLSVFDQNRMMVTPSLQWNAKFNTQLTYSFQYASTNVSYEYKVKHILWLSVAQRFGN